MLVWTTLHEMACDLGSAHHGIITHCSTGPTAKTITTSSIARQVELDACAYRALHSRTTDQKQSQKAQIIAVKSVIFFLELFWIFSKFSKFYLNSLESSWIFKIFFQAPAHPPSPRSRCPIRCRPYSIVNFCQIRPMLISPLINDSNDELFTQNSSY